MSGVVLAVLGGSSSIPCCHRRGGGSGDVYNNRTITRAEGTSQKGEYSHEKLLTKEKADVWNFRISQSQL